MHNSPVLEAALTVKIVSENSTSRDVPVAGSLPEIFMRHFLGPMFYSQVCHTLPIVTVRTNWIRNLLKRSNSVEDRGGFREAVAIQRESPLGGCAAGLANLGGGSHPVAQSSLSIPRVSLDPRS